MNQQQKGGASSEAPSSILKAAIYARVSTQDQNCEMQVRELREYAGRRGWHIADDYVDTGWSGAKASRPQLDRLMKDAGLRRFDAVLVWIASDVQFGIAWMASKPSERMASGSLQSARVSIPMKATPRRVCCSISWHR